MADPTEVERLADISSLRKKRGNVKRSLTSMKKWFAALDKPSSSPIDIEVRMDDLKQIKLTFNEVQMLLDELYLDEEERTSNKEDDHVDKFDKDYYELLASMQKVLKQDKHHESTSQASTSTKEHVVIPPQQLSLKLPDISLPEFTGNIEDWETFKQGFRSLVHSDTRLGSIQKFHYLKGIPAPRCRAR
jgi:hypothetical protein